jgi:hypothetical protein
MVSVVDMQATPLTPNAAAFDSVLLLLLFIGLAGFKIFAPYISETLLAI